MEGDPRILLLNHFYFHVKMGKRQEQAGGTLAVY